VRDGGGGEMKGRGEQTEGKGLRVGIVREFRNGVGGNLEEDEDEERNRRGRRRQGQGKGRRNER
jgi:hypothetical protein